MANEVDGAIHTEPILPVYDIMGNWASLNVNSLAGNPAATRFFAKDNKANYWDVFGNAWAEINFLKILRSERSLAVHLRIIISRIIVCLVIFLTMAFLIIPLLNPPVTRARTRGQTLYIFQKLLIKTTPLKFLPAPNTSIIITAS